MSISAILEVMIGVSFVYLLLSLVITAATEFLSSLLRRRPSLLRLGVRQLLQDDTFTDDFYAHPLIKALRQPGPFPFLRPRLRHPSYIPASAFAQTVIDMFARGKDAQGNEKERDVKTLETNLSSAAFPADLRKALTALYATADKDIVRFQTALEGWFNDAMERVSGWYKRRTNSIVLALALPLVIAANADTIRIVKVLWKSPTLRASLVAEADAFAKAHAEELKTQAAVQQPDNGPPPQTPDVQPEIDAAAARLYGSVQRLETLSLPLGWADFEDDPDRAAQLEEWPGLGSAAWNHWLGWLLSMFAISMGAPFWFDTLNRLINIRAAGKKIEPKEANQKTKK